MEQLKIGVIGLGFIGSLHARILHELPEACLAAVADINAAAVSEFSERYACRGYTDYKEMLDKEKPDAVSITVPDELHEETAVYAAQKGIAILLEKPLAKTAAESQRIIDAAQKKGARLMVAHLLHFDPRYAQLRDAIKANTLGDMIHMYLKRTNPRQNPERLHGKVSVFYYIGIHDFEFLCACMPGKPVRAYCQMVQKVNKDLGCEDTVAAIINFDHGALGIIELCWAMPNNTALGINTCVEATGTSGAGYVQIMDQGISIVTKSSVIYPDTLHWPEYNGRIQGDLKEELAHFVSATKYGKPYIVDTQNALMAVKVVEACIESIRTGMPVNIV